MPEEFIVYLSSTLDDLQEERDIATKVISEFGRVKTTYRADENAPVNACLQDVRACHLYVGILGLRYGWVPTRALGGSDGKSITEMEYEACLGPFAPPGRPPIPRLMFIKDTAAGIPENQMDAFSNSSTAEMIKDFRTRANSDQTACRFKSMDEFRAELRIRVSEKLEQFKRASEKNRFSTPAPGGMFQDSSRRKGQLGQIMVACVPGTDGVQQAALAASGTIFTPFELSPDDQFYLATLDAGLAHGQIGALLLTPPSLVRLTGSDRTHMVAAAIAMLRTRTGHAVLICEGIEKGTLPAEWNTASVLHLPAGALTDTGRHSSIADLYSRIREIDGRLTPEPRFALPYLVIAPTLEETQRMADASQRAFAGFGAMENHLQSEFKRIVDASERLQPGWPVSTYGTDRHHWKCFGEQSRNAERIVTDSIDRINRASEGSRELRLLRGARLVPRRYSIDEYLDDRWGSRRLIEQFRERTCLILIDEVALLDHRLRKVASELLSSTRSAIVAISPCDPAHTGVEALLGDFSYLNVGTLVSRYRNDLDPHCEIAANNINRVERWLSATLPALVASAGGQESDPALVERMVQDLRK